MGVMFKDDPATDWRWQLQHAIRTARRLRELVRLTSQEEAGLRRLARQTRALPLFITPHFMRRMNLADPQDPLRLQVIPRAAEWTRQLLERPDPLGEERLQVVPHLVHRYPDRVLLLVTDRCASYCRFCTRKRWVGQGPTPRREDLTRALDYMRAHPEIKEVILSGGDALMVDDAPLARLLERIRGISSVEIIRIGTRMPVFAPTRITTGLIEMLRRHQPVYVLTHINHPNELSEQTQVAMTALVDHGIPVLNQTVLLRGINDNAAVLAKLFRSLTRLRVRPYYLHQCDVMRGTAHYRVPLDAALQIVGQLRGHVSGLCMPTFVVDVPDGHGKVPLAPDPVVRRGEDHIVLRGFAGGEAAYPLA
ncbi:MAG: KamA family radical SAM protein [Myxococcota bacterium]